LLLLLFLQEEAQRKQAEAEERRRKEIERRMRPRTTADFEILYNELEAWRLQVRVLCKTHYQNGHVAGWFVLPEPINPL
jgi:hypothetical protein